MSMPGYSFILTSITPQVELPFEIIPNHFLQKADRSQTEQIEEFLERFDTTGLPQYFSRYKHELIHETGKFRKLSPDEWRHWIISFEGSSSEIRPLSQCLRLMEHEIELGCTFVTMHVGMGGPIRHGQSLQTYFQDHSMYYPLPIEITGKDLLLASECYSKLKGLLELKNTKYHHITSASKRFDVLRSIGRYSEFRLIGLFSVIEALLTHRPSRKERGNGLTRQIKKKVPLVLHRVCERVIEYREYFDEEVEEELWAKLYSYRCTLVHGGIADFSEEFKALKNHQAVIDYVHDVVKLLIIQSLNEPAFLTDLKAC